MPPPPMTAERFRACLPVTRWTQRSLADGLGVDERQVRRWAAGTAPVPPRVAEWLEQVMACLEANPPPHSGARHRSEA